MTGSEPIAIIGTGCRFPGECNNPSKLWELLRQPKDLLKEIPDSRFSTDSFYHPQNHHHGTSNVRHSYLLEEDLRAFDTQFFAIKPTEANSVDPQQRLLLETVYEGLESAGLSIKQLQGSDTAVYVGVMSADFTDLIGRDTETFPTYFATGTARSILSNRLSYFFDWHGPSMTIDTACSSSLIAMHQAVRTLRSGESSVAVVAGSNLILGPEQYIAESKLQMLSPTGRSRMWDADADGYARGEGVAAIVLKRLSQAIADGDNIDCVIRETGVNQDGKTPGITMPSAAAQTALIRSTYARAGLDLTKRSDRPQYFEAHGTGTPAGDPVEAEAISNAFFGSDLHFTRKSSNDTLYVGSIKTVIGHTEGTAGLAAVIKSSLALQAGTVPPNMLLNKLNPKIRGFYENLKILSAAQDWPRLAPGAVRRISVNSFGFGGANCHAILESYEPSQHAQPKSSINEICFSPFVFSAGSDSTLIAQLQSYRDYLSRHENEVALRDLAWTLSDRRSTFQSRIALSATSCSDLVSKIDENIDSLQQSGSPKAVGGRKLGAAKLRILGVFTGQGAQWPRMGAHLLSSPGAADIIARLDRGLRSLPISDRPSWSLRDQILASADSSLVGTAAISQPVCTAVQILLVDLLRAAGIEFSAVVGHSSGEIGAAYAAGYLNAEDAIRIAYFRGLHLKSVKSKGLMLAVGTAFDDAKELCELPTFEGRICVAASNSPASVTLSGDSDAIEEVKVVFDEEKKFTRLLKVDRAYHSHHMEECLTPYLRSLRQCRITSRTPDRECHWISSVHMQPISDVPDSLSDSYWGANLVRPVRFYEALQHLLEKTDAYDLAIEVGPHPALKGPASQTIQEVLGGAIPYTGTLSRGSNDIEAISSALGFIWSSFGEGLVDFGSLARFTSGSLPPPTLLKGLPTYQWDHSRTYWHESRLSKAFRTRSDLPNELLGRRVLDGVADHLRWRNILRPREISWLEGHKVQGQTVFPCAGYISACVEAAVRMCEKEKIQAIELEDFVVGQAIVFDDDDTGIEVITNFTNIIKGHGSVTAQFSFHSAPNNSGALDMTRHASCRVRVTLGDVLENVLPLKPAEERSLSDIEPDRFYNALGQLGFGYSGPFRALVGLKRKLGLASGLIENTPFDSQVTPLLVQPATLDAAIQSIMLAYCYPGDSMLRSIYLPTGIERLTINPGACESFANKSISVPFHSTAIIDNSTSLSGDVSIYSPEGLGAIQLEGLQTQPLSNQTESTDLNIFTKLVWGVDRPDRDETTAGVNAEELNADLLFSLERVAYFYIRSLDQEIPVHGRSKMEWHFKRLFAYVDHVLARVNSGSHPFAKLEWKRDTKEDILAIFDRYPTNIDLRLMRAVGDNLPAVIRGELSMLEPMLQDNMLNDFYVIAHGMPRYTQYLATMASQIGHRYPHMDVLEIGAGTGGASKSFLKALGNKFSNYTFTDISSGFFEKATKVFSSYSDRMTFKVLDIEKDIGEQGFRDGSYDLIVASLVLHATRNLDQTLRNVRRLLKPGGYLLLLEITENEQMRFGLIFGGLAGWWLGYDDGRALSPCVGLDEWSTLLKSTGFSGIDAAMPHHDTLPVPLSIIVSQAVDEKIEFLQHPLQPSKWTTVVPQLSVIQGGPKSAKLGQDIMRLLSPLCGRVRFIASPSDIRHDDLPVGGTVLCLSDIDEPFFKSVGEDKLRGLQEIFKQSENVLWVTQGSRSGDPYARMIIGLGRTLVLEMLHLRLQFLDLPESESPSPVAIAECLLRLQMLGEWSSNGSGEPLLHSIEPELYLENGRFFVPRFMLNEQQNNRYNSGRRPITEEANIEDTVVELIHDQQSSYLIESNTAPSVQERDTVEVEVTHSISRAIQVVQDCFLFAVLGTNKATGERVLALSPTQASIVQLPDAFVLPDVVSGESEHALQAFYVELIAQSAMRDAVAGDEVLALDLNASLAGAIRRIATDKGSIFKCFSTQPNTPSNYIHPKASKFDVERLVPKSTTCYLNINQDNPLSAIITKVLHPFAKIVSGETLTSTKSHSRPHLWQELRPLLVSIKYALRNAEHGPEPDDLSIVNLDTIGSWPQNHSPVLIKWRSSSTISVQVQNVDTKMRFRNNKTYWLVGLTGGLGQSLCEWMAHKGARYLVISSRNPRVDEWWLEKMRSMGVSVKVVANDISNRDSVQAVYQEIVQEMPPIAGVAQGAMVLHDTMFLDLDMNRLNKVLNPKVQGAIYLEEIFKDADLDFFVFFSSMASVTGNPGQSAYAAANMFMSSLANRRRERGRNASAVHIGAIFGNGYVTRELTLTQQEFLRKVGNLWLSEHDFRQLFAEAILAGQHHRGQTPELSTGLKMVDSDESETITWFRNPMFQHCVNNIRTAELVDHASKQNAPVKVQLIDAVSPAEVREIISDAFVLKLRSSLQVDDDRPIIDLTADNLGIDSLVAVDIRSWFIKELQVEIPVLKILSGATVGEILIKAQELLPKELTPNLDPTSDAPSRRKQKQTTEQPVKAEAPSQVHREKPLVKEIQTKPGSVVPKEASRTVTAPTFIQNNKAPAVRAVPVAPEDAPAPRPNKTQPSGAFDFVPIESEPTASSKVTPTMSETQARTPRTPSTSSWSEVDDFEMKTSNNSNDSTAPTSRSQFELTTAKVKRSLPIGFAQSRFWFLRKYLEDPSTFNITASISLRGPLDVIKFREAVKVVGQRHEALRTRFREGEETTQEILETSTLSLEIRDVSNSDEISDAYNEIKDYSFKLEEGQIMRIVLLRQSSTLSTLIIAYHHINMDGLSLETILQDLQAAYASKFLNPRILQYPNFTEKQRKEYQSGMWAEDLAYWLKEFSHIPAALPLLPGAKTSYRTTLAKYSSNYAEFRVDSTVLQSIQNICRKLKVTPFHFHLAVFYTLITRLLNVEEVCIGISSANRTSEMMQSVGLYLNLLPLLFKTELNQTFTNALKLAREKALAAFVHSQVPFDVVLNELQVPRSSSHSPLFQVLVNYRAGVSETREFCNCESNITQFNQGETPYDLSLDIIDNPGGDARVILSGQSALYSNYHMNTLKNAYSNLLIAFARNPALRLSIPSLYDSEAVKQAIELGRGPSYKYRWPETLPHRIDLMVLKFGDKIALSDGQKKPLTYSEMAKRVNNISFTLSTQRIGHGSRVGVFLEPGMDWICALLSILRLDATYIPLDHRIGLERLSAIVQDCRPDVILTDASTDRDYIHLKSVCPAMNLDHTDDADEASCIPNSAKSDSVAAIMYTSGSTGRPKGIVMTHHTFRNNVESSTEKWFFREGREVTLQQSSYSFDMSLSQTFLTLSNGGTLHIVPKRFRGDPVAISSIIATQGITFTETTPSEYVSWIRHGNLDNLRSSNWRIAVSGGEMVTESLLQAFQAVGKSGLRLLDCYGPTEVTFCSSSGEVNYQDLVGDHASEGTPLHTWPNYSVYIVDANMKPVPVGIPGEVLVGGAGVVNGYLHSELDAQGFTRDSFASPEFVENGWLRAHRTGDSGKLHSDGRLDIKGRISGDTQVKLRGIRMDLREIESAILSVGKGRISDVAVTIRESKATASEFLAAFVTTVDLAQDDPALEAILQQLPLPPTMRPSVIIRLDKLPTNASNKTDRLALRSLPLPENSNAQNDGTALSAAESKLKNVWEEVITTEVTARYQISAESDFFHVGGNSLLLARVQKEIRESFGTSISLFQLFDASTLGRMAALIEDSLPIEGEDVIDWESETAVSPELLRVPVSKRFVTTPEVVILTGATGFLGRALLTRLLEDDTVQKIHCIAIRQELKSLPKLFKSPKIVLHGGDLAAPRLGLTEAAASEIFAEAHVVIHNGADVSFMKSYKSLRPANVESTKELVRLSVPHQLSFHYVSTASVTHLTGQETFERSSVSAYLPGPGDGYVATKWASERYLEKVSDRCELPIWIHRPSSITGDGAPQTDLMMNLLTYSRLIRAVPDTNLWRGWLDFVSVKRVAMQIADEVYEDYSWPGNVKYLYESGDQEIPIADLRGVLEREQEYMFEVLSLEEWVTKAQANGLHPLLAEYLRGLSDTSMVFPRLIQQGSFL
ncbi:putative hybrid NRPS PKS [Rosellinia necatrix]|uniref:Putative hybrid NRPS PKS n=1 Tax=Rosellinia necatrix TaxID=77044 RepID=A0A1W2TQZ5_ROSNE|nr:putative hybrid NRPS PKS [Rosellinia necatrix]